MHTRPTLSRLPASIHGARDYRELAQLGLKPDDVIDFSSNCNPYGPHPAVLAAVRSAVSASGLTRYPDRDCLALREAIAAAEDIPPNYLFPTNGASELIQLVALAFVEPGSRHLILGPTFGEYERAIRLLGGLIHEYRADEPDFRFDPQRLMATIDDLRPAGVWLCNPNNPTGRQWSTGELAQLAAADPDRRIMWVIDEAYRYFGRGIDHPPATFLGKPAGQDRDTGGHQPTLDASSAASLGKTVIIMRSLTKDHSLAGLRLGYAIAHPKVVAALQVVQAPWSVNSLAQVAGVAALQPEVLGWRDQSLAQLQQNAGDLWREISATGLTVVPSSTPYALVNVGDARAFRRTLLTQGLLVRDCTSFGLPDYIRIAAQLPSENKRLVAAVKKLRQPL